MHERPAEVSLDRFEMLGSGESFHAELCSRLESSPFFTGFTAQEIDTLARYAHAYRVEAGTPLVHEGGRDSSLILLTSGSVEVIKEAGYREYHRLTTLGPGKTLGEMSVIDGQPHSASAVAMEATELVLITRTNLLRIAEQSSALGVKLLWRIAKLISLRLRQTSGRLVGHLRD